jgi:lipopolysaccharide export system protein LptC
MNDLVARLLLNDGPARVSANGGQYELDDQIVSVNGPLLMVAADGYRMVARGVSVNLAEKIVTGEGGVEGAIPAGTFSGNRLDADLEARTISLSGNARLRMVPGKLRMPN